MTPDERADRLLAYLGLTENLDLTVPDPDPDDVRNAVIETIREAVAAERERAAKLVEGFETDQPGIGVSRWGESLARRIREEP